MSEFRLQSLAYNGRPQCRLLMPVRQDADIILELWR